MKKYGQAEYAYFIMKQFSEKLFSAGLITEEQLRQLDQKNREDCFRQFCTAESA